MFFLGANWSVAQEPTTVESGVDSEVIPKSPSWTSSYSTTVQGSSPRAVPKDDSEFVPPEPLASGDVSSTTQHVEALPTPAEPTIVEDAKPAVDTPSEEPSDALDLSLGQARLAQPVEAETERPKSPWTPSYTVTTLPGSGSSPRVDPKREIDEAPAVETEAEVQPVGEAEVVETPKIVTPEDEELPEPAAVTETDWTQSYSVTSQPGSPHVSPKVDLEEFKPEPQPREPAQDTSVAAPVVELANVPKTVVTPAVEDGDKGVAEPVPEEESKPTWTQSYSVTSQPGSPRVSPKQVPEEVPELEETKPSWAQSYSVTSQPGSPRVPPKEDLPEPTVETLAVADEPTTIVAPPVEEAIPAPAEVEVPERPTSPWTPSYSVTTLSGSTVDKPPVDVEVSGPEPVETGKAMEEQPKENGTTSDIFEVHEAVAQLAVHDEPQVDVEVPGSAPLQLDLVSSVYIYRMVRSLLTVIPSPNRMSPPRSRRGPPGLLRTRSRNFLVQARR